MNASSVLAHVQALQKPVVTTDDVVVALREERSAVTHILKRLADASLLKRIRHGLWTMDLALDPLVLPPYLTAPDPSYVSFQSALFFHGIVSQIPNVVYVASLAKTRTVRTSMGTYSIHRLAPRFFGGYRTQDPSGVLLASPEKALLDTLYLVPARSRLFAYLPEVELPAKFNWVEATSWIERIPKGPRRTSVKQRLDALFDSDRNHRRRHRRHRTGRVQA
jgi:predicted transcriptional regulator of viral defense system